MPVGCGIGDFELIFKDILKQNKVSEESHPGNDIWKLNQWNWNSFLNESASESCGLHFFLLQFHSK